MNDTNRKVLDSSIIEPIPPFRSVDDLITRERHRQRVRRGAGVIGVAAAVTGLVFTIQAGLGGSEADDRPSRPVQPGQSGSTGASAATPTPRTVEDTAARLSEALRDGLSTVVPGATHVLIPNVAEESYQGYTGFMTSLSVTTSTSTGVVELLALWPVTGSRPPTAGVLGGMFGCDGPWAGQTPPPSPADQQCEEHHDGSGSRVILAQQRYGANMAYLVTVHYSDGAVVRITATNEPPTSTATPVLSLDQLRRIVTDGSMRP